MKFKKQDAATGDMDMTPMIDMTFQLIAFFMFTINFNNELSNEAVVLPLAERAQPVEQAAVQPVFLNVDKQSRVLVPGSPMSLLEPAQMAQLRSYLSREAGQIKKEMLKQKLKDFSDLQATVIIRAHQEMEFGPVQDLIRLCREAGFGKFSLRANRKPK